MKLRIAALGLLALGLCGAKRKPVVTWWESGSPSTLHPLWAACPLDLRAQAPIYDRLVEKAGDGWSSRIGELSVGGDGRITLTLRKDIKWHDGERLTAEDVCATIDAVRSRTAVTPLGARVGHRIQHCAASDDWTAVIRVAHASDPDPLASLDLPVLPAHLGDLKEASHPLSTAPVGTGPWSARLVQGGVIYTPANAPHHPNGRPELRMIPETGDDPGAVQGWPDLPADRISELRATEGWALVPYPLETVIYAALDTTEPPLSNPEARRALDAAIDRTALCASRAAETDPPLCRPTASPFAASTKATNHGIPVPEHVPLTSAKGALKVAFQAEIALDGVCEQLVPMWAPYEVTCEAVPLGELVRIDPLERRKRWDVVIAQRSPATADLTPELSLQGRLNWFGVTDDQVLEDLALDGVEGTRLLHATIADQRPMVPLVELSAYSAWRTEIQPMWMTPVDGLGSMSKWGFPER